MISLEKECYSRQVLKNLAISSFGFFCFFFSPCFILGVSNVSSQLTPPGTMLAASCDGDRIISLRTVSPNKISFSMLPWSWCFVTTIKK